MSVDANALERETLEKKDRDELAKIAGALGGKVTSRTRKADIVDLILELTGVTVGAASAPADDAGDDGAADAATGDDDASSSTGTKATKGRKADAAAAADEDDDDAEGDDERDRDDAATDNGAARTGSSKDGSNNDNASNNGDGNGEDGNGGQRRRRRGRNRGGANTNDAFSGEPMPVEGMLDLRDDGYGFLRVSTLLPSKDDCYVSVKQVRQLGLRKGDIVAGGARPAFRNEKNPAIIQIDSVNGVELEPETDRPLFEELPAAFAAEPLTLAGEDGTEQWTARAIDLLAPIGFGSRVLVAGPPRSGRTTVLQTIARAVEADHPTVSLIVVLLDERPEEIAEMRDLVTAGEVHGSPFDASPDEHVAVTELALARARRIAEGGDDVVVLFDGLTRLARADHASGHGNGRTLGGIDAGAITTAKAAFGAGRNLQDAGSVTLVATVNAGTDSELDAAVYDEVIGAATTHVVLDGAAVARRSFPAIDIAATGTRREELLVEEAGAVARDALRRELVALPDGGAADHADGLDTLLSRLRSTKSNDEVLEIS